MIKHVSLRRVFYGLIIAGLLTFGLLRNGGVFFASDLRTYRTHMAQIEVNADADLVMQHFKRVHQHQSQFVIGVIAIEAYNPVFVGKPYRVYAVGYYDSDHYPRRLINVVCQDGKVLRKIPGRRARA
jgi:hypothetical protein